ncbi:hypothetical protein D3C86_1590100 [compost metagenome]
MVATVLYVSLALFLYFLSPILFLRFLEVNVGNSVFSPAVPIARQQIATGQEPMEVKLIDKA